MPRKAYLQHLEQLSTDPPHPYVTGVRRGDDDGTFTFTYTPPPIQGTAIQISGMIPELADYPDTHQAYVFTTSDGVPDHVTAVIETFPGDGLPIPKLIQSLANTLSRATKPSEASESSEEEGEEMDYDDEFDPGTPGWTDGEDDEPRDTDFDEDDARMKGTNKASARKPELASALRRDLRTAVAAGFRVGVLGDYNGGMDLYTSISIRISKLGISDEAMSAWGLQRSNYLILLIHFNEYYRPFSSFLRDFYYGRRSVEYAVVTSPRYKPTLHQARNAFTAFIQQNHDSHNCGHKFEDDECTGTFISRPLNELLNSRLVQLLQYRSKFGLSWNGAETYFLDNQGTHRGDNDAIDETYYAHEHLKTNLSPLVTADSLSTGTGINSNSFPLLAMQFMLRHFVRCTEFCLVCHKKVAADFEAIKPYVCSTPLCLYQYMALGFGPSMDYAIKNEPTVVDLLVSFCYATAKEGQLRDFPLGMNLHVPGTETYKADWYGLKNELHFHVSDPTEIQCPLKKWDWIVISEGDLLSKKYHCQVHGAESYPIVRLSSPVGVDNMGVVEFNSIIASPPHTAQSEGGNDQDQTPKVVSITICNASFDGLSDAAKQSTIVHLLDTLPSVNEMSSWLKTSSSIANWRERISPAALGVLRWILASNRSCIVPVDGVKEKKVWGLHEDWLQFRFAMGAPDKEQRFVNAVQEAATRMGLTYPSLFAFHGSPLKNWHSIIREGLHFNETVNGRAYGHGCYHSLDLNTSLGYSVRGRGGASWPQSTLDIFQAICLNEIVNSPSEFVSRSPHLVVAQLDWIQTRYLFVNRKQGVTENIKDAFQPTSVFQQDPSMTPRNARGQPLIIPAAASSYRTRNSNTIQASIFSTSSDDFDISSEDEEDQKFLAHDERVSTGSSSGTQFMKTDFRPGNFDMTGIKLLRPPSYASTSATKRLQGELRNILRIQNTHPIHELGWYINPDLVENVYQWIIEFHSFDPSLQLAKDMKEKGITSIVMEARFGSSFPMTPPFIRVIRPRFLDFQHGGGGNVTAGGAMCMELLTNTGWSAVSSLESVFLQVRMALTNTDGRVARLKAGPVGSYAVGEAKDAYLRACRSHGWQVPPDFDDL